MGLFNEAATASETEPEASTTSPASEDTKTPQQESAAEQAESEPVAVPVPKPPSRRALAAEQLKADVANQVRAAEDRFRQELSQRDAEMRRLQSELAMRPVHVVQQPVQHQQPREADPDELMRDALKALDNKDLDTYHRKYGESIRVQTMRELAPRFAQQQPQIQQQQMDPQMIAILAQYPDVAGAPNGIPIAVAEDAKLHHMGHAPGPARVMAAFAAARATLGAGKQPGRAQYDQSAAAVLGGAPTGRGSGANNGAAGPSIMMSADEERTMRSLAKKAGMSWDEYVSDLAAHRPEMVRR